MENLYCKRCGLADNRLEKKGQHIGAYCNGCDSWIKWIQQDNPTFRFGKYKGVLVSEVPDKSYLEWALKNLKLSEGMITAIKD